MTRTLVLWLALVCQLAACTAAGPRPLVVGEDNCDYCRMAITDTRFGGEITLRTGRHRTFDSIECLAAFVESGSDSALVTGLYVSDYETQALVEATTAVFLAGGAVRSPMGRELRAFARGSNPVALVAKYGGEVFDWPAVVRQAVTQPVRGGLSAPPEPSVPSRP